MLDVVIAAIDVDVLSNDVDVDIIGAVAAHGRIVTGWITGVHSSHQIAARGVVSCASWATASSQKEFAAVFTPAGRLSRQFVTVLSLPFGPQTCHVNMDAFESEFLLLLFKRLEQLLLLAVSLFTLQLFGRNRLTGTCLRVGVVCWPSRTFLCVLLLAPLGSTVLEPHLLFKSKTTKKERKKESH